MKKGSRESSEKDAGLVYQVFPSKSEDYSKLTAGDYRVKQLTDQLAQKTSDIERLRDYVTQLEEGEKGLIQELTKQIAIKDEEVSRIAALYAKKEAENRKLSSAFETHILSQKEHAGRIKQLLMKREEDNIAAVGQLKMEISKKDSEIASLKQSFINNPQAGGDARNMKALLDEQRLGKSVQSMLREQVASLAGQVEELKSLVMEKETTIKKLEMAFENHVSEKEESLQREIGQKNEDISALKQMLLQDKRSSRMAAADAGNDSNLKQLETLNKRLSDSNNAVNLLERQLLDEQRLGKSVQSMLKGQVASLAGQVEELKSFLIEKEKLIQSLGTAFENRIAAKEEELRNILGSASKKPEQHLYKEIDSLRAETKVKEESSKFMAGEIAKLKEQTEILHKRLEQRQKLFFESEKAYEQLISQLREQHDGRMKSMINDSTQKEAKLRAELEQEKAKSQHELLLMKEKEKQIEDTLRAFAKTSEQMLKLGGSAETGSFADLKGEIDAREKHLNEKEEELKGLLSATELKITELKSREAIIEKKEQLLTQEQEALNKELDVLNSAGIEITKSKQYLQNKLEAVGNAIPAQQAPQVLNTEEEQLFAPRQQVQAQGMFEASSGVEDVPEEAQNNLPKFTGLSQRQTPEEPATVEEEGLLSIKPEANVNAKPKARLSKAQQKLIQKKAKAAAPKVIARPIKTVAMAARERESAASAASDATEKELFSEMGGYSELDEIKSVVDVGMQHGDSIEQIRESLLSSGYSKQNIEKVLSQVRK